MVGEDKENDVLGGEGCMKSGEGKSCVDTAKETGSAMDTGRGSVLGSVLLTYKRRKNARVVENGTVSDASGDKLAESVYNSSEQATKKMQHVLPVPSHDCSLKYQRDIILEQICQSMEIECGLKKCIQDALAFYPGSGSRTIGKESIQSCEVGSKGAIQSGSVHNDLEKSTKCSVGTTSSVSANGHETVTDLCRCTFLDIIMSATFAKLCSLLLGNGMRADKFIDLSHVNSRMKEKVYESSPMQFHSDIQQIWTNLQKVGADMVSLAKYLSDKTSLSFCAQLGSSAPSIFEDAVNELFSRESDIRTAELKEANVLNEVHTCKQCGEKSDGRNGLVCDSCEEMYRISCIEPSVKEIPSRNWYCATSTAKGIVSPHDNCIACERLNACISPSNGNREDEVMCGEAPAELEESSNEMAGNDSDESYLKCKICHTKVRNDESYKICGHPFCPHKFYHENCMTSKQLRSHGNCWYCPSCLCRACLTDQDDDKIVLCDGCDHAYHIYCMQPPQPAIPRGKWFCRKCNFAIQRIRKAKRSYEKINRSRKRFLNGKLKTDEALNKSGGVDMLLNAAKTLNYEENLAAMGLKSG